MVKEHGKAPQRQGGGARGKVCGYSQESRLRFLRNIATIDWEAMGEGSMHTLTYPDECVPDTPYVATMHRHRYFRVMEMRTKRKIPIIWRVEWKPRQSGKCVGRVCPHVHLISFDGGQIDACDAREMWEGIIGAHRYTQVDVQQMECSSMAALYTAKYMTKVDQDCLILDNGTYLNTGRVWGFHRAQLFIRSERLVLAFRTSEAANMIAEAISAVRGTSNEGQGASATLLGPWADTFLQFLREVLLTESP